MDEYASQGTRSVDQSWMNSQDTRSVDQSLDEYVLLAALLVGKRLNIQPEVVPNASVCRSSPSTEMQCFPTKSWIEKADWTF